MTTLHNPTKRVLNIFNIIMDNPEGLTFTEISELTNIPKSTLSPILKTLVEMKFLSLHNLVYKIGVNTFKAGETFLNSTNGLDIIRNYMKDIVAECNEICQLGIYTKHGVLYLEKIEPAQAIKLASNVGQTFPTYATALGKALLSQFSDEEIREQYTGKLKSYTPRTVKSVDELIEHIDHVRTKGYAIELGEVTEYVRCVAVPLENNGVIFAAMSVSIPEFRVEHDTFDNISKLLLKYKSKIESSIQGLVIDFI